MNFADAMVELVNATDGDGVPAHLYFGPWTAESLRKTTRDYAATFIHPDAVFVGKHGEAAAWENLAKLATATAAAIREGR